MAWTGIARQEHSRKGLRYSYDMTDRASALAAPFIPEAKRGGRRRTTNMREVLNALLYIAASGCAWRLLPKCFPPVLTVQRYFYAWRNAGRACHEFRVRGGLMGRKFPYYGTPQSPFDS